jgi:hypothetical protein
MIPILQKKFARVTFAHLAVLLLVVLGTVGVVKFFGKRGEWRVIKIQVIGKDWSTVPNAVYSGYRPPYWLAESVKKNDVELSVGGGKIAEVVDVEQYSRGGPDYDMYLTVRINGILNAKTNKYVFKGRAIEVGAPVELRLDRALVFGQITSDHVPPEGYKTTHVVVTALYRNADPWIINNIKIGDAMSGGPDGRVVAEVLALTTEPTRGRLLFTDSAAAGRISASGDLFIDRDPKLQDLHVRARLLVEKHNDEWFFGGYQAIKAGNLLWLYFPNVNLKSMEIESVEKSETNEKPQR